MITKNRQAYHLYKGFYKPAQLYLGRAKVAGYDVKQFTGNPLTLTGTYDDVFSSISITGITNQAGTGNPSPDNVRAIHGVKSITISDGGGNPQVINLPQELFSLPDGLSDDLDVVRGKGTQNVGKVVLDGSQYISYEATYANTAKFTFVTSNIGPASPTIADKFETVNNSNVDAGHIATWAGWTGINIFIPKSLLAGWSDGLTDAQKVTAFKSWLSANPVTILYELAAPRAITGTPQAISTYPRQTTISADGGTIMMSAKIVAG